METAQSWIDNGPNGCAFAEMWRDWRLLAQACQAQGKVPSAARILDANPSLEAVAAILVGDGAISAIEGEPLPVDAVRSSVARCPGLPATGLLAPLRSVDGLTNPLSRLNEEWRTSLLVKHDEEFADDPGRWVGVTGIIHVALLRKQPDVSGVAASLRAEAWRKCEARP